MKKRYSMCLIVGMLVAMAAVVRAENWPQWRGPTFNGSSPETGLPETLDEKGAKWAIELPGRGASTPIVWGDRIFLTVQSKDRNLVALCFEAKNGQVIWQKEMGSAAPSRKEGNADFAGPSAVTDGKSVYFYVSTGNLAAFDMDGKELWPARNLQKEHGPWNYQWIYGSSPLLYRGKIYIQVLHRDIDAANWRAATPSDSLADSFILAIDPANGKDLWKVIRPNDAKVESKEAYTTPMPYEASDPPQIVIVGGDCVTGHDYSNGKEIWRAGGWNPQKIESYRTVPSAVVANDLVVVCAPKNGPIMGVKPGVGDVTKTNFVWTAPGREMTSDVAVPAFYEGNLYVLEGEKKALDCVDPKTGKKKWSQKLESRPVFRASPTVADGKVYCINENGEVWVCSATEAKILSQSKLSNRDKAHAEISVANGRVYVRTGEKLYAFGK